AAHRLAGVLLQRQGKLDQAVLELQKAVELGPNFVGAFFDLANAYAAREQHAEAVPLYVRVIRLQPSHAAAHARMANSLQHLERLDDALTQYREAIRLEPNMVYAHVGLCGAL